MALKDSYGREINQIFFEGNSCVKKVILNRPHKFNSLTYSRRVAPAIKMALKDSYGREINQVLFEGNSCVKKVILNRPHKFNSLTYSMVVDMSKKLKEYENDSALKLLILKGNGKAFCSGGDLMSYYECITEGHWTYGAIRYRKQLITNYLLATYKKPLVALIDGLVMGGGVGLSIHAQYRIVTEKTIFAMPEAAIGYFPDVGASYFLSRLPGYFGEYLGLTGAKIRGAEMVACGLATHFVLCKDVQMLENALDGLNCSDTKAISQLISKFVDETKLKQDNAFFNKLKIINRCFSGETVESILLALEKELANGEQRWIVDAIKSMKSACPTSLKIFLKSVRTGRYQNLKQCLCREYIIAIHFGRAILSSNFLEGLKTLLVDKDQKPKWQPSNLELVTDEIVEKFFVEMDDEDWQPLQLPPRANLPNASMEMMSKL